jgi:hypothetical protein
LNLDNLPDNPLTRRKRLFDSLKKSREGTNLPPLNRCLYWLENCNGSIASHSLSKCWLDTISFQGHVVKVKLWPRKGEDGKQTPTFSPELIGQNEVSVFRGFCNKHDTELFRNLDTLMVKPTTDDCMKLIYRSVAREFTAKHHMVATFLDAGMGKDLDAFNKFVFPQILFTMTLLEYKFEIENALASANFSDYEHLIFDLGTSPPFIGATTFIPGATVRGRMLPANREQMTLTLLPTNNGGLAVLSWNRIGNPCAAKFAHALRKTPLHLTGMAIARMFFEMSDNVVFSPVFWYGVPEECKLAIVNMHARSIVNRENFPPPDALVPNYQTDYPFALDVRGIRSL